MGMIDEIRCDQDNFTLDLMEFKTRNYNSLPAPAQKRTHELQTIIYKKLFDDLVSGKTSKQLVSEQFKLNLSDTLGDDVISHIKQAQIVQCTTLCQLMDVLFERMSAMPEISRMLIEYCYQADNSTIAISEVCTALSDVQENIHHYIDFWKGNRQV